MTMLALEGVETALATRLATVTGLYATGYDGTAAVSPAPSVGYYETDFVPATATRITVGNAGEVERDGLFVVRLYSPTAGGDALPALADDVLAAFPRGLTLTTTDGATVYVAGRPAPTRGQLIASTAGRSAVSLSIPWRVRTAD